MKNLFLLLVFLCVWSHAQEEIVYIPDPNFKHGQIIRDDINTNGDNEIQVSEALAFTATVGSCNPQECPHPMLDATGLEAFVNITGINFSGNSDLQTLNLNANSQVRIALLSDNELTEITLDQLDQLYRLDVDLNNLSQVDLHNNSQLQTINLQYNEPLWQVNLANGNNEALEYVVLVDVPNLTCVQTDPGFVVPQPGDGTHRWWYDDYSVFSEDCWQDNLAVEETLVKNKIIIYPNPTQDILNIKADREILNVQLIDIQGRLVKTVFAINQLDMRTMPSGVYVVRVETSEGIFTEKVRKE